MRSFRTNGALGALLDEYEKALGELIATIDGLSKSELEITIDSTTKDDDCRSVQTILSHVVQSGFTYVVEIRRWLGESAEYREIEVASSSELYASKLLEMFAYTEQLFKEYPNIKLNEYDASARIITRWGQSFDVEQLMQHAIVHVLRHRRQIELFKQKMSEM